MTLQEKAQGKERQSITGETVLVGWAALALALVSLAYCFRNGLLLLFGDAVAHLYIARRILDSRTPGFRQLGSVWLPLPHILLLPFVQPPAWWKTGLAGAWLSVPAYVLGCTGFYRLARLWFPASIAIVAVAFYALNPGLLYLATTAMTEPLFLAEMIWSVLLLVIWQRSLSREGTSAIQLTEAAAGKNERPRSGGRLLIYAALVLVGAIFTRYDGWILAAAAWLFVAVSLARRGQWEKSGAGAWIAFTFLLAAAPAIWIGYNAWIFGDPLDFLRGPYSARAIEAATAGSNHPWHPGFHSMPVAAKYFLKAAEMGAIFAHGESMLLWLAALGTLVALLRFRRLQIWPTLLLWIPLPFYAYSIAYGSVPIFIPVWWPFSWYNTRYGMEMLPAFALFGACLAGTLISFAPKWERWATAVLVALVALNSWILLRARPLVYQEAIANSRTRIPFEAALANSLMALPQQGTILMCASKDAGAVQRSGIPLRRILNEGDDREWRRALEDPAHYALSVVALDGDPVAQSVSRHPEGLRLMEVVCSTGQPCARVYRSELY